MALYGLFGLWIGVFLNRLIDRLTLALGKQPSSRCPACGAPPSGWDWVPLAGYILRRGRCASCGARWPLRAPLVELGTGILFALLWRFMGFSGLLPLYSVYFCLFVVILVIDVEQRLILNRVIGPAIAFALLTIPLRAVLALDAPDMHGPLPLSRLLGIALPAWAAVAASLLLGGLLGLIIFATLWLVSPQGMGAGDVKLALLVGLITGIPGVLWVIVGALVLAGISALFLLLARRVGRKSEIPFAPFMILAAIAVLLYGGPLLRWYLGA